MRRRRTKLDGRRWLGLAAVAGAVVALVRFLQGRRQNGRIASELPSRKEPAFDAAAWAEPLPPAPPVAVEAPAVPVPVRPAEPLIAPPEPELVEVTPPPVETKPVKEQPPARLELLEIDEPVTPPRRRRGRWWVVALALVTTAAVTASVVDFEERGLPPLADLDRLGCEGASRWLESLSMDVRTELLGLGDGLFVFGSSDGSTYLTPSRLYGDVSEVYDVRTDEVVSAGLISNGSNWPEGVSVSTEGANFSCSSGPVTAGGCVTHERLLRSVPKKERRRLYNRSDRVRVSLLASAQARVLAHDGDEIASFLLSPGKLRPETEVGAAYVYAPGPSLDVELVDGRPADRAC